MSGFVWLSRLWTRTTLLAHRDFRAGRLATHLTHLARHADSVVRRLDGAVAGSVVQQYTGGRAGRARDIDQGATRAGSEIKADVVVSSVALDELLANFPSDAWDRPVVLGSGAEGPARDLAAARWREVEIHHVDLGLGYEPQNWDQAFVDRFLPGAVDSLPARADRAALLAWSLGRGIAPELGPWG